MPACRSLARQIDEVIEELDLAGLFATYSGRGSKALWPDLLLKLVIFRDATRPTQPCTMVRRRQGE